MRTPCVPLLLPFVVLLQGASAGSELDRGFRGLDAIEYLGAALPRVAAAHDLPAEELVALLLSDRSVRVGPRGQVYYACPGRGVSEDAPSEALASTVPMSCSSPDDIDPGDTFVLASDPSSTKTIFLDFDGHHSVNNAWSHDIVFPPYNAEGTPGTFSAAELVEIQRIWWHVVEDFAPFHVNVTTQDPGVDALTRADAGDDTFGLRIVMTQPTGGFGNGMGGSVLVGSFNDSIDNCAFVFNKGGENAGMTASHMAGHSVSLAHDGLGAQAEHTGSGSGDTSWGPIMGAPFGRSLVQWSRGEYEGATNNQDDAAIIASPAWGMGLRPDDHPDTFAGATPLALDAPIDGLLEDRDDVDAFSFVVSTGNVSVSVRPNDPGPNVDLLVELHDASGALIASSNPVDEISASLTMNLADGLYYVLVDGVGKSDEYTDYGSIGQYCLTVSAPRPWGKAGQVPPPTGNAGHGVDPDCPQNADVPDPDHLDSNCDGIDGDKRRAVFVATSGAPGNPGTRFLPLDDVNAAILLAASDPARDHVYVSEGVYPGRVDLMDGVSVWGGFSAANGWDRSAAYQTTLTVGGLHGNGRVGVLGIALSSPVTLGDVVVAPDPAPVDGHAYGILLASCTDVTLERVSVIGAAGGPGSDGTAGATGFDGGMGGNGGMGGGGGFGPFLGGDGGAGGNPAGESGDQGAGSGGGAAGAAGTSTTDGGNGGAGGAGAPGGNGTAASNAGAVVGGFWLANGDGGAGVAGGGGSGGGGGGGGGSPGIVDGGTGGGGGGGGFPGEPGEGGAAGGSSIALFLDTSSVRLFACQLAAGPGEDGGAGAAGGPGGLGGPGGNGEDGTLAVPDGGDGGPGGNGGPGGSGAGGGGGHSYAIAADVGSTFELLGGTILTVSAPGTGGTGGPGAPSGADGEALEIQQP